MRYLYLCIVICVMLACNSSTKNDAVQINKDALFTRVSPDVSKIDFVNKVEDEELFNILTYRNFYNGGGVAIGDVNNDGMPDIYFTSNMYSNKLYLNRGNFVFEDVTDKAGVGGTRAWSTGVTLADINGDGWLDIYVCNSGDVAGDNKENELFINNQDGTFTEKAKQFNLNNAGFSTHASFFDYDLDGDLDCYILNNSFISPAKIQIYKDVRSEVDDLGGDKLFRNDGNVFSDVTLQSGIYSSKIGFGLGVSVSDLNGDHLPDIYISNDFWERDYLYVNLDNGKFEERLPDLLSICSISSMGADIADIDNDGDPEIFTTDMLAGDNYRLKAMTLFDAYHVENLKLRASYHHQILQNCLHLNNGNLDFQEVAAFAGVAATDWSWGALIFDFENDGFKDIFVCNGITKDIMYVDFTDFISDRENVKKIVTEKGKFDWRDFIPHIPSNPLKNYALVNSGDLTFSNQSDALGFGELSFSNGSAYGDLDMDGDMDLVINNVNMPAFVYRNTASEKGLNTFLKVQLKGTGANPFGVGAEVTIYDGGKVQVLQNFPARGFQSSVEPNLTFGTGQTKRLDSVRVVWSDQRISLLKDVETGKAIVVSYDESQPSRLPMPEVQPSLMKDVTVKAFPQTAKHKENIYLDFNHEILLHRMLSAEGPRIAAGDINGDGLDDFFLPGALGDVDRLFIQGSNGQFRLHNNGVFSADSLFESTCAAFVDLNNDKSLDLVVGSGGNQLTGEKYFRLRVYRNDGRGNFIKESDETINEVVGNFSCIVPGDYDGDGYTDLFIGSRIVPGSYGVVPKNYLLKNNSGRLTVATPGNLGGIGMVTDAVWSDVDKDGDNDLVIVGDWMPVTIALNDNGTFNQVREIPNSSGWWNCIRAGDLDGDGDDDFVLGNWGLNTRFRASSKRPLTMFTNDYDGNGKTEFIINWYPPLDTIAYPFAPKGEILQQLPMLKKKNLKYETYAQQTYETLIPENLRKTSVGFKCEILESSVLWNNGQANFELRSLPPEAQVTPVCASTIFDFDGDGVADIWMGGNIFRLKPQVGRYNSSKGIFLRGKGNKKFEYLDNRTVGIMVSGEVRASEILKTPNGIMLLVARNNDSVMGFKK